jgi:uncharacterized membrane protein
MKRLKLNHMLIGFLIFIVFTMSGSGLFAATPVCDDFDDCLKEGVRPFWEKAIEYAKAYPSYVIAAIVFFTFLAWAFDDERSRKRLLPKWLKL